MILKSNYLYCVFLLVAGYAQADQWAVVTTINYPTKDLQKLVSLKDWHVIVVADKKTPNDWHLPNCECR